MNQNLQQAIAAARSGNHKKAQYLLTQTLQENPEETQAWYLLSLLVDSEDKQIAYLNQVLALDPTHEKAQERLAALTAVPTPMPTSPDDLPLAEQESGDLLPEWMADDLPDTAVETPFEAEELPEASAELEEEELPDWLQESVEDEWAWAEEEEEETAVPAPVEAPSSLAEEPVAAAETTPQTPEKAPKPVPAKKQQPAPQKKSQGSSSLGIILALLVVLAILVGAFLVYLLVTM